MTCSQGVEFIHSVNNSDTIITLLSVLYNIHTITYTRDVVKPKKRSFVETLMFWFSLDESMYFLQDYIMICQQSQGITLWMIVEIAVIIGRIIWIFKKSKKLFDQNFVGFTVVLRFIYRAMCYWQNDGVRKYFFTLLKWFMFSKKSKWIFRESSK